MLWSSPPLPDAGTGALVLGGIPLSAGDTVAMSAVDGLAFRVAGQPAADSAAFTFAPVFSNGMSGREVQVNLFLLDSENRAPMAEDLTLSTYRNTALTARFAATDPEGDLLTFQLVSKPARGAVTMPEEGEDTFLYTPYENKTGRDTFTYVAVDAVGNTSAPATVKLKIEKPATKVTYADLDGSAAANAAIRLAEEGVFVGECMGGSYFFQPDLPVSRSQFVAMLMNTAGVEALEDVSRTGFADDGSIPQWAKPYAAARAQGRSRSGRPGYGRPGGLPGRRPCDPSRGQRTAGPGAAGDRRDPAHFRHRSLRCSRLGSPVRRQSGELRPAPGSARWGPFPLGHTDPGRGRAAPLWSTGCAGGPKRTRLVPLVMELQPQKPAPEQISAPGRVFSREGSERQLTCRTSPEDTDP